MNSMQNALRVAIGESLPQQCEDCVNLREQIRELRAQLSNRDRLIQARGYDTSSLPPTAPLPPYRKPVVVEQTGDCFYCNMPLHIATVTEDHFIPRSKGGKGRNCIKVLACATCNRKKGDRLPTHDEWEKLLSRLRGKRRERAISAMLALTVDKQ
jgi:5-methylcytosine-specific restriction endonuclease McrA